MLRNSRRLWTTFSPTRKPQSDLGAKARLLVEQNTGATERVLTYLQ